VASGTHKNLKELGMPRPLLKWIHSWFLNRFFYISYGEENSGTIKMDVVIPQGSVLAATLFRLHVHFLPSFFFDLSVHMFAKDLALVLVGSLRKRFSQNTIDHEKKAEITMKQLEEFSDNFLLPVNVAKTKAPLVHSAVSPQLPKMKYKQQKIEHVKSFKYLGVHISTKLGWGTYINERIRKIRRIYNGFRQIFYKILREHISILRRVFLAYALPHFCLLVLFFVVLFHR
jgi:hypothetical protein